jgi:hypothetical protein
MDLVGVTESNGGGSLVYVEGDDNDDYAGW